MYIFRGMTPHKKMIHFSPPGMTLYQQEDVLKYFKDGRHKIIIATTVAEEGLDVRKCDLVIRYEHVTNATAMIQARGTVHMLCKLSYFISI